MGEPRDDIPVIDLERYFGWLTAKVRRSPAPFYDDLLLYLFNYEFVWIHPGDEARAQDGAALRRRFEVATHWTLDRSWRFEPCSVLEMMVALCERAEFLTDIPQRDWFWTLIENLELAELRQLEEEHKPYVEEVLYNLNYRLYRDDGRGGMFPLAWPREDQTGIEIWYQLQAYIDEQHLV